MEKLSLQTVIKTLLLLVFFTLAACGGGGADDDESSANQSTTLQGVFLDNKVSGLFYRSGSLSGFTDSNGTFQYEAGASITFEVGGIVLGTAKAKAIMTPVSLVPTAVDETDPTVVNIVRFLITLDSDNDLSNGIDIAPEVHTIARELSLDFTLAGSAFDAASDVQNVIALVTKGVNSFASGERAIDHFNGTLMGAIAGIYNGTYSGGDRGTWSIVVDSDGTITGTGCSTVELFEFGINGRFTSDGELSSFGFSSNGEFFGRFDIATGRFSGNWVAGEDSGVYTGAKADSRSGGICPGSPSDNTAPLANAGKDRTVSTGVAVVLDGSQSTDADGDELSYKWTLLRSRIGAGLSIVDNTSVNASFTPKVNGTYTIQLVVNDGTVDSQIDTVTITAVTELVNTPPIANAGLDKSAFIGSPVFLDGSKSSDAQGDTLTYLWSSLSQPEGSDFVIADISAAKTTFTPDVAGEYVFQLTVSDGVNESVTDTVTFTFKEQPVLGENVPVILKTVMSDFASYASSDITINAPEIAENGAVVPVTVNFPSQLSRLWLFVVPNDSALALTADFLQAEGNGLLSTRVSIKQSGDIVAVIVDSAGNISAAKASVKVTIGSSPLVVDCTVIECAPSLSPMKVKERDGNVKMLVSSDMNMSDYIENIQLQVDGTVVLNIDITPYISKNPFFSFNFSPPVSGTSSELLITANVTGGRSVSSAITVSAP